jgi:hypothetical protein
MRIPPKIVGPPVKLPGAISVDNMFGIQNSQWNTVFTLPTGGSVAATVFINGATGSYVLTGSGDIGSLSSITYHNTMSGTPMQVTFSFTGAWSLHGDSGMFLFQNGADPNTLDGQWSSDVTGASGTWTGTRAVARTFVNDFSPPP